MHVNLRTSAEHFTLIRTRFISQRQTVSLSLTLSVFRCSQTTDRSYCSVISGDISNCSYRPSLLSLARSHPSLVLSIGIGENPQKRVQKQKCSVDRRSHLENAIHCNLDGDNCGHKGDRLSQNGEKATRQNGDKFRNYYVANSFVVCNDYYSWCVMCFT